MTWLVWALSALAIAIVGQMPVMRLTGLRNAMVAFILLGAPIGLVLITVLIQTYPIDRAAAGVLLYAFLCEIWMFIISSSFSSVSANLLLNLRGGTMHGDEIDRLYDNHAMIGQRVQWLSHIGAAVEIDGRLLPTRRGLWVVQVFNRLRHFFDHR